MNYNDLTLFGFGLGGVLIHNLTKIQELKKKGEFTASQYFSAEWPSMSISMTIVALSIMGKHEVAQLEQAGKWLGLAFVAMGYMGQSLFVKMMRFLQKKVDPKDDNS